MCDRPHLYPPDFGAEEMVRLKAVLQARDLKVTNLNSFTLFAVGDTYLPSWIEPEKESRDIRIRHTLECLKVADRLGCGNISVPPAGPPMAFRDPRPWLFFIGDWSRSCPWLSHLMVLVEPEPQLLIENSLQFGSFIKEVASASVGLNFDMGHFYCVQERTRPPLLKNSFLGGTCSLGGYRRYPDPSPPHRGRGGPAFPEYLQDHVPPGISGRYQPGTLSLYR